MADGLLTPEEYFPPRPAYTRQAGGRTHSQQALRFYHQSATHLQAAWHSINQKNSFAGQSLDLLFDFELNSNGPVQGLGPNIRNAVTNGFGMLKSAFAGPYDTSFGELSGLGINFNAGSAGETVHLNLPSFLANPAADLRDTRPTYAFDHASGGVQVFGVGQVNASGPALGSWPVTGQGQVSFGGMLQPGLDAADANAALGHQVELQPLAGSGTWQFTAPVL